MVTRTKAKKIRKVIARGSGALAADTDSASTLHTVTDPGTTKRIILTAAVQEDAYAAGDVYRVGICITRPGETLPDTDNIASEENRWIFYEEGLASDGTWDPNRHLDMKIQRKVKDGDVISLVKYSTTAGDFGFCSTIFIDET